MNVPVHSVHARRLSPVLGAPGDCHRSMKLTGVVNRGNDSQNVLQKHVKSYYQSKMQNQSIRSKQSFSDGRNHVVLDKNELKSFDLNKCRLVRACSTCVCMHWTICRFLICVSGQISLKQCSISFHAENSVAMWRKYSWGVPSNTQIKHDTDAKVLPVLCQLDKHVRDAADVSEWCE